jgi:hypothetical protein
MANTLTNLAPDLYKAADVVARELVGAIPSSIVNGSGSEQAAVNQTVRSFRTNQPSAKDFTASMTIPEGDDQTVENDQLTLTKQRAVQIPWTGEEVSFVESGNGFQTILGDQFAQAMRTLTNEMEVDLLSEIYKNASRSVGTAGTTPFGSNFDKVAELRQILVDNGMPPMDGQASLVMNTAAGTKLRNLAQLQKANEAGSDRMLRQGALLDLQGLMMKESAGVATHSAGDGSSYQINSGSGLSAGATTIPVDNGSGTIVAGDVVTIGNHDYIVASDLSGGSFTINRPGLQEDIADDASITVNNDDYAANVAFHRNAAEIAVRPPRTPEGGDAADDQITIQDPRSGLTFTVSIYKGYRKAMYDVAAVWGVKAWKDEFIASLRG